MLIFIDKSVAATFGEDGVLAFVSCVNCFVPNAHPNTVISNRYSTVSLKLFFILYISYAIIGT